MFGIGPNNIVLVESSMSNCKTNSYSCDIHLGTVSIQIGNFQRYFFSLLLFLLALISLTMLLQKVQMGYALKKNNQEHILNHLLLMDDLQSFDNSNNQIDFLVQTIFHSSKKIVIEFEISKCPGCPRCLDVPEFDDIINQDMKKTISKQCIY